MNDILNKISNQLADIRDSTPQDVHGLKDEISRLQARCEELEKNRKEHALNFFRWWWNQSGTNTEQGYDEWIRNHNEH